MTVQVTVQASAITNAAIVAIWALMPEFPGKRPSQGHDMVFLQALCHPHVIVMASKSQRLKTLLIC